MSKVDTSPLHEDSDYERRCALKLDSFDKCLDARDWAELYTDIDKGIYSWQRVTSDGFKSMKAEFVVEGRMESLVTVLNDN